MEARESYVVCIGAACMDEYYTAQSWPEEGNKCKVDSTTNLTGGMIPNAACVFAGYGVKTYLYDVMNSSASSMALLDDLKGYGLDVSAVQFDDSLPDAKCIIVLTPGDRTILVVDSHKPVVELDERRLALMRGAAYIYTTVFEMKHFKNPVAFVKDLKAHGAQIVYDVEASTFNAEDMELLHLADILFFNEFGFAKFKGSQSDEAYVQSLFDHGVKIVTVTLGKHGSLVRTPNDTDRTGVVDFKVVDPTGAGDTFNSSFVRCILAGKDIHEAAKFANMAASWSVTQLGAKGGVNTVEAVERMTREHYAAETARDDRKKGEELR